MKRMILMLIVLVSVVALTLATAAQARRVDGSTLGMSTAGAANAAAVSRAQLMSYVAQVQPAYAELTGCACCCNKVDLPAHRCAACDAAAARMTKIVARLHKVQTELSTMTVPPDLVSVHSEMVTAASLLHNSSEYMADVVRTAPERLLVTTLAAPPAGRGGAVLVMRPSPLIVRDAEFASLMKAGPRSLGARHARSASAEWMLTSASGAPGDQALAHLARWRDAIVAQARAAGVNLTHAIAY